MSEETRTLTREELCSDPGRWYPYAVDPVEFLAATAAQCPRWRGWAVEQALRLGREAVEEVDKALAAAVLREGQCPSFGSPHLRLTRLACRVAGAGSSVKEVLASRGPDALEAIAELAKAGVINVDLQAAAAAALELALETGNPRYVDAAVRAGLLPPEAARVARGEAAPGEAAAVLSRLGDPVASALLALYLARRSVSGEELEQLLKAAGVDVSAARQAASQVESAERAAEAAERVQRLLQERRYAEAYDLLARTGLLEHLPPEERNRLRLLAQADRAGIIEALEKLEKAPPEEALRILQQLQRAPRQLLEALGVSATVLRQAIIDTLIQVAVEKLRARPPDVKGALQLLEKAARLGSSEARRALEILRTTPPVEVTTADALCIAEAAGAAAPGSAAGGRGWREPGQV